MLLEAEPPGQEQGQLAAELPARPRRRALARRGRAELLHVEEVVDGVDAVGRQVDAIHQLAPHPLGVGQDAIGAAGERHLREEVEGVDEPVAHRRDHDGNAHLPQVQRHPRPEVGLVAVGVHDGRPLLRDHPRQLLEAGPAHPAQPQHVPRLARRKLIAVVDLPAVVDDQTGREARRQPAHELEQLPLRAALPELRDHVEDLVGLCHPLPAAEQTRAEERGQVGPGPPRWKAERRLEQIGCPFPAAFRGVRGSRFRRIRQTDRKSPTRSPRATLTPA
jgi:hypothetical protein